MSARIAVVFAALLALSGAARSQPKPPATIPPANVPTAPAWKEPQPLTPVVREKSVDDLLAELEDLQAQKARLEKQEAELKTALRKRLDAQAERLKKLGVAQPTNDKVADKEPDRVGRIIIEGNAKTPDDKILKLVELRPGQILAYPHLEAARQRLEKAGFRGAAVEVVPNELDSHFKDIRVRVTEGDKR